MASATFPQVLSLWMASKDTLFNVFNERLITV